MSKKKKGIFNIGSGSGVNLIKIISLIQNKKINMSVKPKNNLVADITKVKRLGWKKKYNIQDIIKEYRKK
jgi:UDP-glucose 4-epimerase